MNAEILLKHFDRMSDAPAAVPRFRRFIVELAVRGKLVEQDPKDEPVTNLLVQSDVRRREVAASDRRADSNRQEILRLDHAWPIPSLWGWAALADLTLFIDYRGQTPNKVEAGIPLITAKNVKRGFINADPAEFVTADTYTSWMTRGIPTVGDVLFTTEAPMGNAAVVRLTHPFALAQRVICLRPYCSIDPDFLALQLSADPFQDILKQTATGLTAKGIKAAKLKRLPVAVPPLVEQQRIVTRVHELLILCDRLEGAQNERERRRDRVTVAATQALKTSAAKQDASVFYIRNLSCLSAKAEQIETIRQTLRSCALQGRLVCQDVGDEPVSNLLRRLGKQEKVTGYFPIPSSWAWVTVDSLGDSRLGKMLDKAKNKGHFHRYIRNVNVRWFDFDLADVLEMRFEDDELEEFSLVTGDVLICEGGEPGRAAVWDGRDSHIYFQKAIHRVRFLHGVLPEYFVQSIREAADSGRLATYFTGTGIKHFTGKGLASFAFPLPPFAEQVRIVRRLDQLTSICTDLERQLKHRRACSAALLESVLDRALKDSKVVAISENIEFPMAAEA